MADSQSAIMTGPTSPFLAPLFLGQQTYHTPTYTQMSEEERANVLAQLGDIQQRRLDAAKAYASETTSSVKTRTEMMDSALDALVGELEAAAKNNMASAQTRSAAAELAGTLRRRAAERATDTVYSAPALDSTNFRLEGSAHANAIRQEVEKLGIAQMSPEDQKVALTQVFNSYRPAMVQSAFNYLGSGPASDGDVETAEAVYQGAVLGALGPAAGIDPSVRDAVLMDQMVGGVQSIRDSSLVSGLAASRGERVDQARADQAAEAEYIRTSARGFGLPPEVTAKLERLTDQYEALANVQDPSVYATMVRSAADTATAPLAAVLDDLDGTAAALQRSMDVTDDPFFSEVRTFAGAHPWYEKWLRSQGFRHHEEAVRWLLQHPETIGGMDKLWGELTQELGPATPDIQPNELRNRMKGVQAEVIPQNGPTGPVARPVVKTKGINTTPLGRAASELAGLFRRDPGAARAAIPDAPSGGALARELGKLGAQGRAQFGARPYWDGAGAYEGDPRNRGTGGSVMDPAPSGKPAGGNAPLSTARDWVAPKPAGGTAGQANQTPGTAAAVDPVAQRKQIQQLLDPYARLSEMAGSIYRG